SQLKDNTADKPTKKLAYAVFTAGSGVGRRTRQQTSSRLLDQVADAGVHTQSGSGNSGEVLSPAQYAQSRQDRATGESDKGSAGTDDRPRRAGCIEDESPGYCAAVTFAGEINRRDGGPDPGAVRAAPRPRSLQQLSLCEEGIRS